MNRPDRNPVALGPHVSPDDLARFVIDALDPGPRQRLERHVVACAGCAGALAREAAAEMALQGVWPAVRRGRADRGSDGARPLARVLRLRPAAAAAPGIAAAAAAVGEGTAAPAPARNPALARPQRLGAGVQGSSWNGLAAAAMTVLFLGYWTDAGRSIAGRARGSFAVLDAVTAPAICGVDEALAGGSCAQAASDLGVDVGVGVGVGFSPVGPGGSGWACANAGEPGCAGVAAVVGARSSSDVPAPGIPAPGPGPSGQLCRASDPAICARPPAR